MCICESFTFLDEWCWPLKRKIWFFAIWTLTHGILILAVELVFFILSLKESNIDVGFIIAIPHIIAGILMILSIQKSKSSQFMTSIVISSILPFVFGISIYLPIMQIIFIIIGCRYYSTVLKE